MDGEMTVPSIYKVEQIITWFLRLEIEVNNVHGPSGHCAYFLCFQNKMCASCTASPKATISSLPWRVKLRMGHFARKTATMSVLTDCVR